MYDMGRLGWGLHYADPSQPLTTAREDMDDLDRDLCSRLYLVMKTMKRYRPPSVDEPAVDRKILYANWADDAARNTLDLRVSLNKYVPVQCSGSSVYQVLNLCLKRCTV